MATIALLGLNLALLRSALSRDVLPESAIFGPIGLAAQLGLMLWVHSPPGHLSFWVGFTSASLGALVGTAWIIVKDYQFFGDLWFGHVRLLTSCFGRFPGPGTGGPAKLLHFAVVALFFSPAQLLLAFVGGILAMAFDHRSILRSGRAATGRPA
jgi:hypothetical protein